MEFILEEENALNVYLEVQTEQNMKFGACLIVHVLYVILT